MEKDFEYEKVLIIPPEGESGETSKRKNRNKGKSTWLFWAVTITIIGLGILTTFIPIITWKNTAGIERLLYIFAISSVLFCALAIILFVPALLGIVGLSLATNMTTSETGGKRSPIFQVPKNHRWILRNVWSSDPITLVGYEEKKEGWNFYVPTILHSDEGLVDLTPIQLDLKPFFVNCKDGNDVGVDVRATYFVRSENGAAIKYLINTSGENIEDLVTQRIKVSINQAMDVDSRTAIGWGSQEKEAYGTTASNIASGLLKNDPCVGHCKDYGLEVVISVENITPTPEVKIAADRKAAESYDKEAMALESEAMKNMIQQTGANPTVVMVAQMLSDGIRTIFGERGKKDKKYENKKEGGKKNE